MPIVFKIDPSLGLVCKRGEGEAGESDFREQLLAELAHPDFRAGLRKLADYRHLRPNLSTEEIRSLATATRQEETRVGAARWAVVAGSDLVFGLTRMYMAFLSGSPILVEVFRTIEEARSWLGLPDDYRCPLEG